MSKNPQWLAFTFSFALLMFAIAIIGATATEAGMSGSWFRDWYRDLSPDVRDIVKASLGPTVAILLFVLTQAVQAVIAQIQKRGEVKRIVSGICREIEHNLADQKRLSSGLEETTLEIKSTLREDDAVAGREKRVPTYRPLLGITDATQFYDAVSSSSPLIAAKVLTAISAYYRCIADERIIVKAIENYAFLYISVQSRCDMVDELQRAFKEAQATGDTAVETIKSHYPESWFSA